MKLITFDADSVPTVRKSEATIRFSRTAASCLSAGAVLLTNLGGGNMIAVHQDEENPEDWYISLSEAGFKLRDDKGGGALHFNNASMANTILDALGIEGDSAAFRIAAEPTEIDEVKYWGLITAKPIIREKRKKK